FISAVTSSSFCSSVFLLSKSSVSNKVAFIVSKFAIISSLSVSNSFVAFINISLIVSSSRWGVSHFLLPLNLWLHCQTVRRYLLFECHTFEPYQLPHSPHLIFPANICVPLCLFLPACLASSSRCTMSNTAGSIIASWLFST